MQKILDINMMTNEKLENKKALYLRVREQILHDLITRSGDENNRYYTETELAKQMNVCRNTVRKAMGGLEREGYIIRRRSIGTIINKRTALASPAPLDKMQSPQPPVTENRRRIIVILPPWNDSVEGFYTGGLLQSLSSPTLNPPFTVEIRHCKDPFVSSRPVDGAIIPIDPAPETFPVLQELANQGVHIIAIEPQYPIPGLINLFTDRRTVTCQAVKRFYELGHRAVGLLNRHLDHLDYEHSLLGYLDAHRELNLPIPPGGILQAYRYTPNNDLNPDLITISAWICTNMGSLNIIGEACRRTGLSIPQDASVICLDDPGDSPVACIGKKVSVVASNSAAAASLIHTYLNDWQDDRRGTMIFIPSEWKDRETIAPPRSS